MQRNKRLLWYFDFWLIMYIRQLIGKTLTQMLHLFREWLFVVPEGAVSFDNAFLGKEAGLIPKFAKKSAVILNLHFLLCKMKDNILL